MTTRALVLHPELLRGRGKSRAAAVLLEEAVGLAEAIDLEVAHAEIVQLKRPRPATLLGSGMVDRFRDFVAKNEIVIVIVDAVLTPVQQRNLERGLHSKVIDREALILEIFGARARTKEGMLQVELAALSYQRSRLVKSWTHLERQRGGFGFLGGPGESQLEIDRRLITDRITRVSRDLDQVKRTRGLHRSARRKVPYPVVALVGYTNAGKSTLFNRLTEAEVFAADMLFATLDPTMRRVTLDSDQEIILSDTVGFISNLPTDLIAAFRATLEEVAAADLILHVRDVSSPDHETQRQDVEQVLEGLGIGDRSEHPVIEVWNKVDRLSSETRKQLEFRRMRTPSTVICSAVTGEGCGELVNLVSAKLKASRKAFEMTLPLSAGAALAWLHEHGELLGRCDTEEGIRVRVRLERADWERFRRRFAGSMDLSSAIDLADKSDHGTVTDPPESGVIQSAAVRPLQ